MSFPGEITTITLTGTYINPIGGAGLNGYITIQPSTDLIDGTGNSIMKAFPQQLPIANGIMQSVVVPTTDNATISPSGWYWIINEYFPGNLQTITTWYANTPSSLGSSTDLSDLPRGTPSSTAGLNNYPTTVNALAISGTPTNGQVLTATSSNTANWQSVSGVTSVTSFNGRSGAVVAATNDYSFAQLSGTAGLSQGGTGASTAQGAINALAGGTTSGSYLRGNGTNVVLSTIPAGDVPTLNQNTTGTASNVTGTVAIANGGTGQITATAAFNALSPLTTLGDVLYAGAAGSDTRLAGNTTATKQFLTQTGTGSGSAAPAWGAIAAGDVPTLNQNTTGTAASATNFTGSLAGDVTGTQGATVVGKVNGVSFSAAAAQVAANLNSAAVRSATATVGAGEETVFTGSTGAQTLTLPVTPPNSTINVVCNMASVSVTLAPGAGATLNNQGTTGNITITAGYTYTLVYISASTTWYVLSGVFPTSGGTISGAVRFNNTVTVGSASSLGDNGVGEIQLANAFTVPTTNPTGGVVLYSTGGVFNTRNPQGLVQTVGGTTQTTTTTTTVANTVTQTALQTFTVPANDPIAGAVYELTGYGVYSVTGTPTITFTLLWAGTTIAASPAISLPVGISNSPFFYEVVLNFRSTTSLMACINLSLDTSISTDLASTYIVIPTAPVAVTTTASSAMTIAVTWGTASASNTISLLGGMVQRTA